RTARTRRRGLPPTSPTWLCAASRVRPAWPPGSAGGQPPRLRADAPPRPGRPGEHAQDAEAASALGLITPPGSLGADVMPFSFSSVAIHSRSTTFLIFVPDIGHSVTNRTYRGTR